MTEIDQPEIATDKTAVAHVGPGTVAGRYLRQFWHPVYVAEDLQPGRAAPVRLLGEDFTLYRGESGSPHLVGFRCAHRGAQMSAGWVEDDCIRCIYHGWAYDQTGQCVDQPAEHSKSAAKVRIGGYAVRESMGLIFAYIGGAEEPPFPRYPGFDDWDGITFPKVDHWRYNYFQSLENSVDPTHTTFVHKGSHDYSSVLYHPDPQRSGAGLTMVARPEVGDTTFIGQLGMPNSFYMNFPLPPDDDLGVIIWWVPVDDESHHLVTVRRVPKRAEAWAAGIKDWGEGGLDPQVLAEEVLAGRLHRDDVDLSTTNDIFFQDFLAQLGQGIIQDRAAERLGQGDKGVSLLRRIWTEELRKVERGEEITRWASPTEGPVLYYKPVPPSELDALLDSPIRRTKQDVTAQ
jgi:5,5'-dehydrodivanillate O-demethylase